MNLEALLGEAYHEGMTIDEVNQALSTRKLADLSTGNYVNKEAAEAEKRKLAEEKKALETKLKEKLTDDERAAQTQKEKDDLIEKLQSQLQQITLNSNKSKLISTTSDIRTTLDIKSDDKDFDKFANLITLEDDENSTFVSNYVATLLKNSYEKGKADATKENIADNSNLKSGGSTSNTDDNSIGAKLAKRITEQEKQTETYNYFK